MRREQLADALFEQFGHNTVYTVAGNERKTSTTVGYHVTGKATYPANMGSILAACEHLLKVHLVEGVRALDETAITKDGLVNLHNVSSNLLEEIVLCYFSLGGYESAEQFALELCALIGPGYAVRAGRKIQKLAGLQVIEGQFAMNGQTVELALSEDKGPIIVRL